jgi:acetylornithine/N-succinyldiaminopimelate aminotransferase
MAVAKGLGGGFPVGACLATEDAAKHMTAGTHGSTFGGNPLAMAAANAVLDVLLEPGFLDGVTTTARKLWWKVDVLVAKHGAIFELVRGKGMMIGIKCKVPNGDVVAKVLENGLLTVPAGDNVVRLLPPLIIGDAEIDAAISILDKSATELTG